MLAREIDAQSRLLVRLQMRLVKSGKTLQFNETKEAVPPAMHWQNQTFMRSIGRTANDTLLRRSAFVIFFEPMTRTPNECQLSFMN